MTRLSVVKTQLGKIKSGMGAMQTSMETIKDDQEEIEMQVSGIHDNLLILISNIKLINVWKTENRVIHS